MSKRNGDEAIASSFAHDFCAMERARLSVSSISTPTKSLDSFHPLLYLHSFEFELLSRRPLIREQGSWGKERRGGAGGGKCLSIEGRRSERRSTVNNKSVSTTFTSSRTIMSRCGKIFGNPPFRFESRVEVIDHS
jgi:hypothetical protein